MALSAFNINDYKEKYRWTGKDSNNDGVQLRILQKSSTAFTVKAIVGLVDMRLAVQGARDDVFAPIAKTSLSFSLVDAPDLSTPTEKAGDWQEFFTPDSTGYLVQFYREGAVEWQGFITPDSWQEPLDYHGAITITARDNIGHCSDIEFDGNGNADGLATIRSLIEAALDAVEFPMALTANVNSGDCQTLRDSHGYILDSYVCVSEFEGKTWGAVLEDLLHAIGYTLRFSGYSTFMLAPIRNIPLGAYTTRSSALSAAQELEFYDGNRELDPAVRQITEKIQYDSEMETRLDVMRNIRYQQNAKQSYDYYVKNSSGPTHTSGSCWSMKNLQKSEGEGWQASWGFFDPQTSIMSNDLKEQGGAELVRDSVMLAACQEIDGSINPGPTYKTHVGSTDITLRFEFGRNIVVIDNNNPPTVPYTMTPWRAYISKIKLRISYIDPANNNVWYYGADGWQNSASTIEIDAADKNATSFAADVPIEDISALAAPGGYLCIEFANIVIKGPLAVIAANNTIVSLVACLTAIKSTLNCKSVLASDIVTTINNEAYNVKVERKPQFGAMSAQMPWFAPSNYPNALWAYDGLTLEPLDYTAYFNGEAAGTAIPLPAQIHKQILCYRYSPLEVLEGYCGRPVKSHKMKFGQLCSYKGKYYIIQSGTLDCLTNRLTSARLHEFAWYADMWNESNNPDYEANPVYDTDSTLNGANGNSAISGGPSGGGGGGGGAGTVTSVGLSVPTGFNVGGSPVTGAGTLQLGFASGYALPKVDDVIKGIAAYGWGNHANQGYLKTAADIAGALGYVPANSLNGLQRPRIKIVRGMADPNSRPAPRLMAEHPLVGSVISPSDACFVLMVYCKRRGKKEMVNTIQYRDKWGEARGKLATSAALTFTAQAPSGADPALHLSASVPLDTLRLHIINNYISLKGEPLPTSMTISEFKTTNKMARFGRRAYFSGTNAEWKAKTHGSRLFGIAVRYTNPSFAALVDGPLAETTRSINGIPRYIYSDITPIRVTVGQESVPHINLRGESAVKATAYNPNTIGFQLGVGMA